jgi:hypothetical protein
MGKHYRAIVQPADVRADWIDVCGHWESADAARAAIAHAYPGAVVTHCEPSSGCVL